MGSDWPVTDPNPLWAIHTAVHRTGTHADPHAIGEGVFDTPLQAQEGPPCDGDRGLYRRSGVRQRAIPGRHIVKGKLADLVALDQDISPQTISGRSDPCGQSSAEEPLTRNSDHGNSSAQSPRAQTPTEERRDIVARIEAVLLVVGITLLSLNQSGLRLLPSDQSLNRYVAIRGSAQVLRAC